MIFTCVRQRRTKASDRCLKRQRVTTCLWRPNVRLHLLMSRGKGNCVVFLNLACYSSKITDKYSLWANVMCPHWLVYYTDFYIFRYNKTNQSLVSVVWAKKIKDSILTASLLTQRLKIVICQFATKSWGKISVDIRASTFTVKLKFLCYSCITEELRWLIMDFQGSAVSAVDSKEFFISVGVFSCPLGWYT